MTGTRIQAEAEVQMRDGMDWNLGGSNRTGMYASLPLATME